MSTSRRADEDLCDFLSEAVGHFACFLPPGHAGRHRGRELGCGPLLCSHDGPLLDAGQRESFIALLDELKLAQVLGTDAEEDADSSDWRPEELRDEVDVLSATGRNSEALALSFYALRLYPGYSHLVRQRAGLLGKTHRWELALGLYSDLYAAGHLDEMRAADRAEAARCLIELGRPEEALKSAERALLLSPEGFAVATAHLQVASALWMLDRSDEALRALDRYEALEPATGSTRCVRTSALIEVAKQTSREGTDLPALEAAWGRALEAANDWLRADPSSRLVHRHRAEILRRLGRSRESLDALDRFVALAQRDEFTVYLRVDLLRDLGQLQDALELADDWIQGHPDAQKMYWLHGEILMDLNRWDEAGKTLERYERLFPRDFWSVHMWLPLLMEMDRMDEGAQIAAGWVAQHPDDAFVAAFADEG